MKKYITINKKFSEIINIFNSPIILIMLIVEILYLILGFIGKMDMLQIIKYEFFQSILHPIDNMNYTLELIISIIMIIFPKILTIIGLGILYFSARNKKANIAKISLKCLIVADLIDFIIYLIGFSNEFNGFLNMINPFFYMDICLLVILYVVYINLFSTDKYKPILRLVFSFICLVLVCIAYYESFILFMMYTNIEFILVSLLSLLFYTILVIMLFVYHRKMKLIVQGNI